MELDDYPESVLLARGRYATARSLHEDAKSDLSRLCGKLSAVASQVLKQAQPADGDDLPIDSINKAISDGRVLLTDIEDVIARIQYWSEQRAALKTEAWGK